MKGASPVPRAGSANGGGYAQGHGEGVGDRHPVRLEAVINAALFASSSSPRRSPMREHFSPSYATQQRAAASSSPTPMRAASELLAAPVGRPAAVTPDDMLRHVAAGALRLQSSVDRMRHDVGMVLAAEHRRGGRVARQASQLLLQRLQYVALVPIVRGAFATWRRWACTQLLGQKALRRRTKRTKRHVFQRWCTRARQRLQARRLLALNLQQRARSILARWQSWALARRQRHAAVGALQRQSIGTLCSRYLGLWRRHCVTRKAHTTAADGLRRAWLCRVPWRAWRRRTLAVTHQRTALAAFAARTIAALRITAFRRWQRWAHHRSVARAVEAAAAPLRQQLAAVAGELAAMRGPGHHHQQHQQHQHQRASPQQAHSGGIACGRDLPSTQQSSSHHHHRVPAAGLLVGSSSTYHHLHVAGAGTAQRTASARSKSGLTWDVDAVGSPHPAAPTHTPPPPVSAYVRAPPPPPPPNRFPVWPRELVGPAAAVSAAGMASPHPHHRPHPLWASHQGARSGAAAHGAAAAGVSARAAEALEAALSETARPSADDQTSTIPTAPVNTTGGTSKSTVGVSRASSGVQGGRASAASASRLQHTPPNTSAAHMDPTSAAKSCSGASSRRGSLFERGLQLVQDAQSQPHANDHTMTADHRLPTNASHSKHPHSQHAPPPPSLWSSHHHQQRSVAGHGDSAVVVVAPTAGGVGFQSYSTHPPAREERSSPDSSVSSAAAAGLRALAHRRHDQVTPLGGGGGGGANRTLSASQRQQQRLPSQRPSIVGSLVAGHPYS